MMMMASGGGVALSAPSKFGSHSHGAMALYSGTIGIKYQAARGRATAPPLSRADAKTVGEGGGASSGSGKSTKGGDAQLTHSSSSFQLRPCLVVLSRLAEIGSNETNSILQLRIMDEVCAELCAF